MLQNHVHAVAHLVLKNKPQSLFFIFSFSCAVISVNFLIIFLLDGLLAIPSYIEERDKIHEYTGDE